MRGDVVTEQWNCRGDTEFPVEGRRRRGVQANPHTELKPESTEVPSGTSESAGNHTPEKNR